MSQEIWIINSNRTYVDHRRPPLVLHVS